MLTKIPRAELVDFVIAVNADDGLQKASTVTFKTHRRPQQY